jgi:aryl-alcohol dehydrogenase-like predicted oxidoreductase
VGEGRIAQGGAVGGPDVDDEHLYSIVDALDVLTKQSGKTISQIALNWLLQRPSVATVVIGARNEAQLRENLGALGWSLTPEQTAALDEVSRRKPPYPYWDQRAFQERNPAPTR